MKIILPLRHPLCRLCLRLPMWLPISILPVRIGWDTTSFVAITLRLR